MKPEVKDYAHYSNIYDQGTVFQARLMTLPDEEMIKNKIAKIRDDKKKKEYIRIALATGEVAAYFFSGERYINKDKTIKEWKEQDQQELDFYESIKKPRDGTYCHNCYIEMTIIDKDIRSENNDKNRILFTLKCDKCGDYRGVYDNGEEWVSPNQYCSKCGGLNDEKHDRKGDVLSTVLTCTQCGHTEKSDYKMNELTIKNKPDPDYARDRKKYCLTEEQGQQYITQKAQLKAMPDLKKMVEEREANQDKYDKVAKLNKLKVADLKDLLTKEFEKQKYISLQFTQPKMERYVTISFTAEDAKSDREEYDSKNQLKRLINKTLKDTNWRLMNDGISCRLGVLSGRLKGYESEEDLLKLVK